MIIQSRNVWIGYQFLPLQIQIENGKITKILEYNSIQFDFDFEDKLILPGFIDIHTHGGYGVDFCDDSNSDFEVYTANVIKEGVTSFYATTVTSSKEVLLSSLKRLSNFMRTEYIGARMNGIHFEGPFISADFKGAQPEKYIIEPNVDSFKIFQEASDYNIKLITMASELDSQFEMLRYCQNNGIIISLGHSGALYDEVVKAYLNGAKSITHVFNGMTGMHHRIYGLAGAAHRISDIFCEIIADGHHVAWPAIHNLMKARNPDYNILVTDSVNIKGCKQGEYVLGGQDLELKSNDCVVLKGTNQLAGSVLSMNKALKNVIQNAQVPTEHAIKAVTSNPARLMGIDHVKGRICVGFDADFAILNNEFEVCATMISGKFAYMKD